MLAFSLFGKAMDKPIEIERKASNMLVVEKELDKGLNQGLYRKSIIVLIVSAIIGLFVIQYALHTKHSAIQAFKFSQTKGPLLLNSGIVEAKEAEVSVIFWFENEDTLLNLGTNKPMPNWVWDYKALQSESGKKAVTVSGHCIVNKNEESNLYKWYTNMARQVSKTGGHIYLDERVPQIIDISAYLSQANAIPSQWALLGNTVSIAGYQNNLITGVMAGKDRINIQLLSRGNNTKGQTVLAIPALLEEF